MRETFISELKPDFVLITSLFEGLVDDAVSTVKNYASIPTAVVLYDLIPYINPKPYLENPVVSNWYLKKIEQLKKADLLLSISKSSGQEAVDWLNFDPSQVVNISTACDDKFQPVKLNNSDYTHFAQTYNLTKPFVMYTGGIDYRKNIEGLIRAYAQLPKAVRQHHQLAVVCSVQPHDRERLTELAKQQGLGKNDYIMTGFVPEEDLIKLYNACKLFIFPSWHEGFGLPALEAMQCGAPVIASNNSSLPEVVGLDEALFDPLDDQAITAKLLQGLTDEAFRQHLIAHGKVQAKLFNWDNIATTALTAMEGKYNNLPKQTNHAIVNPVPRKRLAYLSPLPPERSGISDYSAELLEQLSQYYLIDVITDQENVSDAWIIANTKIRSVAWFKDHSNEFDRVLYHFGNSHFHQHMFDLLSIVPGVVVLHDFYLSAIQSYMSGIGVAPLNWKQHLYYSHGYMAVYTATHENYPHEALWTYPTNLKVLQDALGVIVHSENSKQLANQWYGNHTADKWHLIPHLRHLPAKNSKEDARESLGFADDDFIICSFGIINKTKRSLELVEAFIQSELTKKDNTYLILVGENDGGDYGKQITNTIRQAKLQDRIQITGWADTEDFRAYLQAADVGVQLRTLSRGETSGTVLDCMNYGLATIVNANGSMAYLDKDSVMILPDDFTQFELQQALEQLYASQELREKLGHNALQTIKAQHNPQRCAAMYYQAIESTYLQQEQKLYGLLHYRLVDQQIDLNQDDQFNALATNFPIQPKLKQVFVDISELVQRDAKSGIQRVVRSVLQQLLNNPPTGYRIEPVYATTEQLGYLYARKFMCQFLEINDDSWAVDTPIDYSAGDIYLGLDLQPVIIPHQASFLNKMHLDGVKVSFIVYDLLAITHSEYFQDNFYDVIQNWMETVRFADQLICISRAVADEVIEWLKVYDQKRDLPLAIDYFHLGADLASSVPSTGMPNNAKQTLQKLATAPTFLMVGTVEPRKGHGQVLKAFEQLWQEGFKANLVIVGKHGWKTEALAENIHRHKQLNKQLFWLEGISDEYLNNVYETSDCLIAASYGEGFGLPLIEAAQHNLPIIARDIPVFKEVAGVSAYYFADDNQPSTISSAIKQWLKLFEAGQHPTTQAMSWITWQQSTDQLLAVLLENNATYKTWMPNGDLTFWGRDKRLHSQIAEYKGVSAYTSRQQGFLFFGPYLPLKAGDYQITVNGNFDVLNQEDYLDLVYDGGTQVVFKKQLIDILTNKQTLQFFFTAEENIKDFEIRLWVDKATELSVDSIQITQQKVSQLSDTAKEEQLVTGQEANTQKTTTAIPITKPATAYPVKPIVANNQVIEGMAYDEVSHSNLQASERPEFKNLSSNLQDEVIKPEGNFSQTPLTTTSQTKNTPQVKQMAKKDETSEQTKVTRSFFGKRKNKGRK